MACFMNQNEMRHFSKFDDKNKYAGAVPSARFLLDVYKEVCSNIQPQLDQEQKKVACDHLSIDGSFKVPKHLAQINGKKVYNALITGMNQNGTVHFQLFAGSESHEQMRGPLQAFHNANIAYGYPGP